MNYPSSQYQTPKTEAARRPQPPLNAAAKDGLPFPPRSAASRNGPPFQPSSAAPRNGLPYPPQPALRPPYSPRLAGLRPRRPTAPFSLDLHSPWLLFIAITGLISLVLLPIIALGGTYTVYMLTGRVFPGVTAGPVAAGDLTAAELAKKIDAQWNRQKSLALSDGKHALPVTPVEVGLWVDPQATAARAYQVGRGGSVLEELLWLARFGRVEVDPVVVFSADAARAGLERLSAQINQPAQNATLRLENGQWVAVKGQNGSQVNIDQTVQQMAGRPKEILTGGLLPLVLQPVAPQVSDLTPVLDKLRSAMQRPLKLEAFDPIKNETIPVDVPPATLAGWVTVSQQGSDLSVGLDGQQVSAYLDQWKASLGPDRTLEPFTPPADLSARWQDGQPLTAIVHYNPFTYTVQSGETLTSIAYKVGMPYWKIQQANPGMDPNQLYAGQALTIPSRNDMLPLPIVLNKRIVISISQQRLWTYENGQQTGEHVISTGIDRSPTIPGIYQVRTHEANAYASVWDLYMPDFIGIYEGWPGFMNGIHGLPTLSSGKLLWAGYLGRPVSYGCIILGLQEAHDLYTWAEEGVIVEIQP